MSVGSGADLRHDQAFLLEETYEVLDAIDRKDWAELRGELGDLLLQAVFFCADGGGRRAVRIADALTAINEKLIRRHPHVFGDGKGEDRRRRQKRWDEIKAQEKKKPEALLDAVPRSARAGGSSADYVARGQVGIRLARSRRGAGEARRRAGGVGGAQRTQAEIEDELGDLLFVLVNLARFVKVDPEQALRRTNAKFRQRFGHVEQRLAASGKSWTDTPIEEMEALWQEAKK